MNNNSATIRKNKNPNRKPVTPYTRNEQVALSICDCGNAITDGSILCLDCEIELEEFNGFSVEELAILEARLYAQEAM